MEMIFLTLEPLSCLLDLTTRGLIKSGAMLLEQIRYLMAIFRYCRQWKQRDEKSDKIHMGESQRNFKNLIAIFRIYCPVETRNLVGNYKTLGLRL